MMVLSLPNMPQFNPIRLHKQSQGGGLPPERPELPEEAVLLRIFIGEDDHHKRLPLYEAIVLKARDMHLAGATAVSWASGSPVTCTPQRFFDFQWISRW
jgi:hypothetical protein